MLPSSDIGGKKDTVPNHEMLWSHSDIHDPGHRTPLCVSELFDAAAAVKLEMVLPIFFPDIIAAFPEGLPFE